MDNFDLRKYLAENKLLKEEMSLEIDDDFIELTADSGTYDAYIEDNGTVDFSVTYEDEDDRDGEEFDEDNWKDILGPNHAFVKISNQIPTKVEAVDDYVMITVDVEDLKGISNLSENKLLKEELTWFIDDENSDVRYKNDAYLKEVGDKIKELYSDISDEDLNKIIIMAGDQYSREEDFHGDSITSSDFVDAAVEIYQTDILSTRSNDEDDKYFHPDSPFRKDGVFGGWSQAQYDAYQENPRKYEKYLMRGGDWEI